MLVHGLQPEHSHTTGYALHAVMGKEETNLLKPPSVTIEDLAKSTIEYPTQYPTRDNKRQKWH